MQHIDKMDWKKIYHLLIACPWKSIIIKNGSVSWPVSTCSDYNFFLKFSNKSIPFYLQTILFKVHTYVEFYLKPVVMEKIV